MVSIANRFQAQRTNMFAALDATRNKAQDVTPAETAAPAVQNEPASDEVVLQDLLGLFATSLNEAQAKQAEQTEALSQLDQQAEAVANAGGKKAGKRIPPGLAKKSAADLPGGNPWKARLQQEEDQAALSQQRAQLQDEIADEQQASQEQLAGLALLSMGQLLKMFQERLQAQQAPEAPVAEPQVEAPAVEEPAA